MIKVIIKLINQTLFKEYLPHLQRRSDILSSLLMGWFGVGVTKTSTDKIYKNDRWKRKTGEILEVLEHPTPKNPVYNRNGTIYFCSYCY